jgi:oligopeptide/dipeptide ABC transporter ATP-binding protein
MLLKVNNLSVTYNTPFGKIYALNDINFELYENEVLGIIGESGSGKSTLAYSILNFLPKNGKIEKGEIYFNNTNILNNKEINKIRWKKISIIFQNSQNVFDPLERIGNIFFEVLNTHSNLNKNESYQLIKSQLKKVGLSEERLLNYPHELSGGTKQRLMIALALLLKPSLIIADEPTTGLDVSIQLQILDLLLKLRDEENISIILITHDLGVARYMSNRIIVMYGGEIMEEAEKKEILDNPKHPYTYALKNTMLSFKQIEKKEPIKGFPKPIFKKDIGCVFAERCPYAKERCYASKPIVNYIENHKIKCFYPISIKR